MPLIVQDPTNPTEEANSYVDLADARTIAESMAVELPADDAEAEKAIIKGTHTSTLSSLALTVIARVLFNQLYTRALTQHRTVSQSKTMSFLTQSRRLALLQLASMALVLTCLAVLILANQLLERRLLT